MQQVIKTLLTLEAAGKSKVEIRTDCNWIIKYFESYRAKWLDEYVKNKKKSWSINTEFNY